MATEWLQQYSQTDIARSPRHASGILRDGLYKSCSRSHVGSYNLSDRSYPDSIEPDEDDLDLEGFAITSGKLSQPMNVPLYNHGGSNCADFGGDGSASMEDDNALEIFMQKRRPSISFDPKVRLNDGYEADLKGALPKLSIKTRPRGKSVLDVIDKAQNRGRARSENDSQEYDPNTGERLDEKEEREKQQMRSAKYTANQSRWPLLQSTVDELASETPQESSVSQESVSLTSKATLSPEIEEARTPVDIETTISPFNISSPLADWITTKPKDIPKQLPLRSKSYALERNNSYASRFIRASRRSTNSNSASPASAFLSRYLPTSPISQPDDEGQEIGDYVLGREIGFGGFSIIREAFTISGQERVVRAVKIVRKNIIGRNEQENDTLQAEFEHEVEIWRSLSHPYILPLFAVYNTELATFAITQLNTGGTLFDAVRSNRSGLDPKLSRRYAFQLAAALRYLHEDMHIVHRDLKLENCLVDMSGEDARATGGKILLCDFGLADYVNTEMGLSGRQAYKGSHPSGTGSDPKTPVTATHIIGPAGTSTNFTGSLPYAAPELLESDEGLLSTSVDMWAYGVVLFAMMMGKLPFSHTFAPRLRLMILGGDWDKNGLRQKEENAGDESYGLHQLESPDSISCTPNPLQGLSEVVERCMELDPLTRWDIQDVLCSQWLREEVERTDVLGLGSE